MGVRALAAIAIVGCFSPSPPQDVACSSEGFCPSDQHCVANRCVPLGDDGAPDAPIVSDARADAAIADASPAPFALSGARWLLPCTGSATGNLCPTGSATTAAIIVPTGPTWAVDAEIHGFAELGSYTGGSAGSGDAYLGGSASTAFANIYELDVSSPPQKIFVNNKGNSGQPGTIDYVLSFEVAGGATVTFVADPQDGEQLGNTKPTSVPGVTDPPQPYDGQFVRLDVTAAVAQ